MTHIRVTISLPPDLAEAAKRKSEETGVPVSTAVQRWLRYWVATGELPPLTGAQQKGETRRKSARKAV